MISKEIVENIVNQNLTQDAFLVEVSVQPGNHIIVYLDRKSEGISLDACATIAQRINESLNRDEEDYELEVSSPGLRHPFKVKEQYYKNIGQSIEVKTTDGTRIEGQLLEVSESGILIEEEKRIRVEGHKKKEKQISRLTIDFSQIKETRLILNFNQKNRKNPLYGKH